MKLAFVFFSIAFICSAISFVFFHGKDNAVKKFKETGCIKSLIPSEIYFKAEEGILFDVKFADNNTTIEFTKATVTAKAEKEYTYSIIGFKKRVDGLLDFKNVYGRVIAETSSEAYKYGAAKFNYFHPDYVIEWKGCGISWVEDIGNQSFKTVTFETNAVETKINKGE